MSYKIKLEHFEGPLDLLLFFIKRDKLDIYDIPISRITNEFLEYIKLLKSLSIEVGGEFIVIASLLMKIKSTLLLPNQENDNEEMIDPRLDLVYKLIEYKQFKEKANQLNDLHTSHSKLYQSGVEFQYNEEEEVVDYETLSIFRLIEIYKAVMDRLPDELPIEIKYDEIHVEEQIQFIRSLLSSKTRIMFSFVLQNIQSKIQIIVIFMALLEMMRDQEIVLKQCDSFEDIKIYRIAS